MGPVLSPWCPGEETLSDKLILLEETKRKSVSGKSQGKTSQGITKIVLEERRRQTKTRNKYPVAVDPDGSRNATLAPAQEAEDSCLGFPFKQPQLICWKFQ